MTKKNVMELEGMLLRKLTIEIAKGAYADGFRKGFTSLMDYMAKSGPTNPEEAADFLLEEMKKGQDRLDKIAQEGEQFIQMLNRASQKKGKDEESN